MTKTIKSSLILSVVLLCASAFGQTLLNTTTLSAAIYKSNRSTQFAVASVSNIKTGDDLFVDSELMSVVNVPATGTTIQVIRGYGGTAVQYHNSGALVFDIPAAAIPYALVSSDLNGDPSGACTRGGTALTGGLPTNQSTLYLPIIDTRTATVFDCLGGVFIGSPIGNGVTTSPQFEIQTPPTGGTAYTSLNSTGTTLAATTMYCIEADLLTPKLLTGIAVLNGTTAGGTDKHLVALYDSAGNLLANSAVAGAATSGTSAYQKFAFTSTYFAIPAQYFACMQTNGTTDTVRMVVTGTQDTYLTKGVTGQTFGTLASFTVPTTFTTAVGPYSFLY